jgi:lipopolysaccharide transport system permease protein
MVSHLRELYAHRDLLLLWTLRDVKVRYKQSLLGAAWAVIQPLTIMVVFTLVFSVFAKIPSDGVPYPLFSFSALVPWTLLSTAMTVAVPSLVNNMNLVTKTYFPREILPLAAVAAALVDFGIATVIFVAMLVVYRSPIGLAVVVVPLLLVVQLTLTLGITLWAAALNVFYRDLRFVVPLGLQLWMYATPIIYPLSLVPARYRALYLLNPMASIIDGYRAALLHNTFPSGPPLLAGTLVSVAIFVLGYRYFKHAEPQFADLI